MNRLLSTCATTALLALATVLVPAPATAELCGNCADKQFTTDVGKCARCGAATASGAFKLCLTCSAANRQCEACRTALPAVRVVTPPVVPPGKEATLVIPAVVTPGTEVKLITSPVVTAGKEVTPAVTQPPGVNPNPPAAVWPPPGINPVTPTPVRPGPRIWQAATPVKAVKPQEPPAAAAPAETPK